MQRYRRIVNWSDNLILEIGSGTADKTPRTYRAREGGQMPEARLLHIDPRTFRERFGREPFPIRHGLAGHPLFETEALIDLAQRSPGNVQWHRGDLARDETDRGGLYNTFGSRGFAGNALSIRETLEQIETNGSWMLIRDIGSLPGYAELLARNLGVVRELCEGVVPGMQRPRSDVVVASPRSVTPFHLDEEQNFLLQIRGWKQVTITDGRDPAVLTEADLEAFYAGNGELHPGRLDACPRPFVARLEAGMGSHIPSLFPHCVENGDEVSVAMTTFFFTAATERRRDLYKLKRLQRRLGLPAAAVGAHPRLDAAKLLALGAARRLRAPFREAA